MISTVLLTATQNHFSSSDRCPDGSKCITHIHTICSSPFFLVYQCVCSIRYCTPLLLLLSQMRPLRVHGQWYDLSSFKHPGGPIMLSLGEGRDATALFESHHPFTSYTTLERVLRKYKIEGENSCILISLYSRYLLLESLFFIALLPSRHARCETAG